MVKVFFITFIKACFATIRPLLGPPGACSFELSCTDYALMQLNDHRFHKAVFLIFRRVLSCNPLTNLVYRLKA